MLVLKYFDTYNPGTYLPAAVVEDLQVRGNLPDLIRNGFLAPMSAPDVAGVASPQPLEDDLEVVETFLPEGFPGRGRLIAAGYTTLESLPHTYQGLVDIRGIGDALAQEILQELDIEITEAGIDL